MKNILYFFIGLILIHGLGAAVKDFRPPFDKSPHAKTVWCQINPWFPFNKQPVHDLGGPNIPWKRYEGADIWGQGMKTCDEYGLTGWLLETSEPGGWWGAYRSYLDQAKKMNVRMKIGLMFGFYSKTAKASLATGVKRLAPFKEDLKNHPNVARVGDRPVIMVYNPLKYRPEEWKMIFDGFEKEFGPMVFLANFCHLSRGRAGLEKNLQLYMPYFDGVTNYGSDGIVSQKERAEILGRVMHRDFPQKIYEGGVHTTYTCHFHMGGLDVPLSRNFRKSFDYYLESGPDSLNVTNLFDHYENSLIFPCYEREDFKMRYMQYRMSVWKGEKFPAEKTPELVLTNYCSVLPGMNNLEFEVLGFPLDAADRKVSVQVELCNTSGKVLRVLPAARMELDQFREKQYSLPADDFIGERAIVPRLVYFWKGKKYTMNYNPMTVITPSIRTYYMYWARSTKNQLKTKGEMDWTLGGCHPGETFVPDSMNIGCFTSRLNTVSGKLPVHGYGRHTIRRDGVEFYSTRNDRKRLDMSLALPLPSPGKALHYYHLEMESPAGRRIQTLPVWSADGSRAGKVSVPFWMHDGSVKDIMIEGARVPFYHYPCETDSGNLLIDVSGYLHNGFVSGSGYGGGHLGYTGYNYYHNGPVTPMKKGQESIFKKDADGRGMLHFSGREYVTVMGGTAFPLPSTFELFVRPSELGKAMGILGSGNNQLNLSLEADGRVKAVRGTENEDMGGKRPPSRIVRSVVSRSALKPGTWYHLAATYDLRKLRLYIDGRLEGETEIAPIKGLRSINHMIIGAGCAWVWKPVNHFKGDIRNIRFYGRNLAPAEFLTMEKGPLKASVNPYQAPARRRELIFEKSLSQPKEVMRGAVLRPAAGGLLMEKGNMIYSARKFTIDPEAEYELSFQISTQGAPVSVYAGFMITEVASRSVHFNSGTETELLEPVAKGGRILRVRDASAWKKGPFMVAFQADPDGMLKDIPNRNLQTGIRDVRKTAQGWEIELTSPSAFAAEKGSWIREHRNGATYNFIKNVRMYKGTKLDFSARCTGISAGVLEPGKFWPGSRTFRVVICLVGKVAPGDQITVDQIKLVKIH